MQMKLTSVLVASSLFVGTLAAPERRQVTISDIVIPSSVLAAAYSDLESIVDSLPTSLVAEVKSLLPTGVAEIQSAVSAIEAGSIPGWLSTLETAIPTAVIASVESEAESLATSFASLVSFITPTATASSTVSTASVTSSVAAITPASNSTVTTNSTVPVSPTLSAPTQSAGASALELGKGGAFAFTALSGLLGLALYL